MNCLFHLVLIKLYFIYFCAEYISLTESNSSKPSISAGNSSLSSHTVKQSNSRVDDVKKPSPGTSKQRHGRLYMIRRGESKYGIKGALQKKKVRRRSKVITDELDRLSSVFSSVLEVEVTSSERNSSSQTNKCHVRLKPLSCVCVHQYAALNLHCIGSKLKSIPRSWTLEIGPSLIRTLNLARNDIDKLKDGDFFGLKVERLILANNKLAALDFLAFWGLEYNLKALDLSYNGFLVVPVESLRLLHNLRSLSLKWNKITTLNDYSFSNLRRLEILLLDGNPLVELGPHSFSQTNLLLLSLAHMKLGHLLDRLHMDQFMGSLKGLSLADNKLKRINAKWLYYAENLWYLSFADNKLSYLGKENELFYTIRGSLQSLDLSGNRFKHFPTQAVKNLRRLEYFDLSRNRIRQFRQNSFENISSLTVLRTLNLSYNQLEVLEYETLKSLLNQNRVLDFRFNRLTTIDETVFQNLTKISENKSKLYPDVIVSVYLSGNPFLCNCLLKWLVKYIKQQRPVLFKPQSQPLKKQWSSSNIYRSYNTFNFTRSSAYAQNQTQKRILNIEENENSTSSTTYQNNSLLVKSGFQSMTENDQENTEIVKHDNNSSDLTLKGMLRSEFSFSPCTQCNVLQAPTNEDDHGLELSSTVQIKQTTKSPQKNIEKAIPHVKPSTIKTSSEPNKFENRNEFPTPRPHSSNSYIAKPPFIKPQSSHKATNRRPGIRNPGYRLRIVDWNELLCDRPDSLYGHGLAEISGRDLSCSHNYYYYYEIDEYGNYYYYDEKWPPK